MAIKGRNMMGGRNPKRKKAIDEAVGGAMASGRDSSPRPRLRPKAPMKRPNATSPRPRMRPEAEVDVSPRAEQGDIELMMQEKMNRGDGMNMAYGGKVKKYEEGGEVDERTARMRRARADANIDQKMDADNMPTSRAMQRKKNKSKGLADMLMGGSGNMKAGGKVKKMKAGGKVRGAGIAQKGVRACQMR